MLKNVHTSGTRRRRIWMEPQSAKVLGFVCDLHSDKNWQQELIRVCPFMWATANSIKQTCNIFIYLHKSFLIKLHLQINQLAKDVFIPLLCSVVRVHTSQKQTQFFHMYPNELLHVKNPNFDPSSVSNKASVNLQYLWPAAVYLLNVKILSLLCIWKEGEEIKITVCTDASHKSLQSTNGWWVMEGGGAKV